MQSFVLSQLNNISSNVHNHILYPISPSTPNLVCDICDLCVDFPSHHIALYFNLCSKQANAECRENMQLDVSILSRALFNHLWQMQSSYLMMLMSCGMICRVQCLLPLINICHSIQWTLPMTPLHVQFDSSVHHSIKCKNTAWKRATMTKSDAAWAQFRDDWNKTKGRLRAKHDSFIESLPDLCISDSKVLLVLLTQPTIPCQWPQWCQCTVQCTV